jgi:nicotinamidase-related amidase
LSLSRERAVVLVVDVQEGFRKAVPDFDAVAASVGTLVQGANALGVPVRVSEQYPKGLGHTAPEVADHLDGVRPVEKTCFSAERAGGLDIADDAQVVLCGIESHICAWQTARDLLERGVEVHVVRDGVASRTRENRELGIELMERAGAAPTSVEAALFELLGAAGSDEFKAVQRLVK